MNTCSETLNQSVRLRRFPAAGPLVAEDFEIVSEPLQPLRDGQIRIRTRYASVDAGHRAMIDPNSDYVVKLAPGDQVPCAGVVGPVIESRHSDFKPGDYALAFTFGAWQKYFVPNAAMGPVLKVDPALEPLHAYIGVLGLVGFTGYIGIFEIGKPKLGETVVVSAAAGAVGAVAGQLAKIAGARVVGIAGGADKCRFVTEQLGFDACVDYKAGDLDSQLQAACPNGIDVYFENVGGAVLEAVWPQLNVFGRVVMCGQISQYAGAMPPGPNLFACTLKRLTIRGFLAFDHYDLLPEFQERVGRWYREGQLRHFASVAEGFENAYAAVNNLVSGGNRGKQVIHVSHEP